MKTVSVVATEKEYADFLKANIEKYLGKYAQFKSYSIAEIEMMEVLNEDFVLLSAFNIFQQVRRKISNHSEIVVLSLSLNKKQMASLDAIPKGTKALLVNFDSRTCMHTITSMYDAGFRDVELYPYYGVGEYDHSIKIAITPNEVHLVPAEIHNVINVGESSVDMNSLYNIADKLGVYDEFSDNEAIEARKEYYYINSSMDKLLNDKESTTDKMKALIRLMNEGIIVTDVVGKIHLTNEKADQLLSFRTKILKGFNIQEVLPEIDLNDRNETLIRTNGLNLTASSVEVKSGKDIAGYILTLSDFEEIEEKQHDIRSKLSETNNVAKYHFKDIIGTSDVIKDTLNKAERVARADSSVMITGESGTGKELFAQSIHNASSRRNYNFVAVNCAAIPENLLESEMFGFEEGSFTGARKGGRMGFFELAHRGTIFLDEIGEMPLQLQSKLLRTLEEKKVIRVGSNKNIDVDVRVIVATNKDLYSMVQEGKFREDLYYRINVLPLSLPPLRDRKDDIRPLMEHFLEEMHKSVEVPDNVWEVLGNYSWHGNIRELRNVAEFIASQGKQSIGLDDLPPLRVEYSNKGETSASIDDYTSLIERFILNEGKDFNLLKIVLAKVDENTAKGIKSGRGNILKEINSNWPGITEADVRYALSKLSNYGFVTTGRGRTGSAITPQGHLLLGKMENDKIGFIG